MQNPTPRSFPGVRNALGLLLTITGVEALGAPASAAPVIRSIQFDWSKFQEHAPGSDNWPLTWCEDDHQYTSWGDGGGFGASGNSDRVSLGFGRIEGPHASFNGVNVWGGKDPEMPATFNGKVESMLCLGGKLYGWHSPGSSQGGFDYKQLIVSDDKGRTWIEDAFPSSRVDGYAGGPGLPYMINYGKNYGANQDGYVYTYWIRIEDPDSWDVQVPGVVWLMRAPAAGEAFTRIGNWKWFAGMSGGNPQWSSNPGARQPVLVDPEGMMRNSAVYVPGLNLYLMITNHTSRNSGDIAIWEARKPWGPWTEVMRDYDWPDSDPGSPLPADFTFGVFSPKWFSASGRSGVLVFFRPDQWNSVPFTLPEPGAAAGLAGGGALLALLARRRSRIRQ